MKEKPENSTIDATTESLPFADFRHKGQDESTRYAIDDIVMPTEEWRELVHENQFLPHITKRPYRITAITALTYDLPTGKHRTISATLDGKEELALKYLTHAKTADASLETMRQEPPEQAPATSSQPVEALQQLVQ